MNIEQINCSQTLASSTKSCFSCNRQAAGESAAGAGGSQGGVDCPSPTSCSCCCSLSSCQPESCFFSARATTTTTTLISAARVCAADISAKPADSVGMSEENANQRDLKPTENKKYPKHGSVEDEMANNCSSSCKQILSDVPSADEVAEKYAAANRGRYVKLKVRHLNTFTFKCCLDHKLQLTQEDINNGTWCKKCTDILKIAQKFAKKKEGALLDDKISSMLNFRCSRGHIFQIKAAEYAILTKRKMTKWCNKCSGSSKLLCSEAQNQAESWQAISGIRSIDKVV